MINTHMKWFSASLVIVREIQNKVSIAYQQLLTKISKMKEREEHGTLYPAGEGINYLVA